MRDAAGIYRKGNRVLFRHDDSMGTVEEIDTARGRLKVWWHGSGIVSWVRMAAVYPAYQFDQRSTLMDPGKRY